MSDPSIFQAEFQKLKGIQEDRPHNAKLAFSPDGKTVAILYYYHDHDEEVLIWDRAAKRKVATIKATKHHFETVDFSADGKWLLLYGREPVEWPKNGELHFFDTGTWKAKQVIKTEQRSIQESTYNPARNLYFAATRNGGGVDVWDLGKRKMLRNIVPKIRINKLVCSPDGKLLAVTSQPGDQNLSGGYTSVWNVDNGKCLWLTKSHSESHWHCVPLAFSPDGQTLASCAEATIILWETATGKVKLRLRKNDELKPVVTHDHRGKQTVHRPKQIANGSLTFTKDGRYLISTDKHLAGLILGKPCIRLWDPVSGTQLAHAPLQPDAERASDFAICAAAWPDDKSVSVFLYHSFLLGHVQLQLDHVESPAPPTKPKILADLLTTSDAGKKLLQAVLAQPEEDAPRKAAAAWLEKQGDAARAKLITLQCAAAMKAKLGEEASAAEDLVVAHFDAWTAPIAKYSPTSGTFEFRRGFAYRAAFNATDFDNTALKKLVAAFPTIEELDLNDSGLTDAGLEHLLGLVNLRRLCLQNTRVTPKGLERLAPLERLVSIEWDKNNPAVRQALNKLYASRNRRFLKFDAARRQAEAIRYFNDYFWFQKPIRGREKELNFSQQSLLDADLIYLTPFQQLQKLSFFECWITSAGFETFAQLENLTHLDLNTNDVKDLTSLRRLKKLEYLSLQSNEEIKESSFAALAEMPNLQHLDISFCQLSEKVVPYLAKLKNLKKLQMSNNNIMREEMKTLRAALPLKGRNFDGDY